MSFVGRVCKSFNSAFFPPSPSPFLQCCLVLTQFLSSLQLLQVQQSAVTEGSSLEDIQQKKEETKLKDGKRKEEEGEEGQSGRAPGA